MRRRTLGAFLPRPSIPVGDNSPTTALKTNTMTRPKKEREDKRGIIFRVCLTASERQKLEELAAVAGLTPSDFVRVKTLKADPYTKKATPERASLIKLQAELNKLGSNANQIARALNRRQDSDSLTGFNMADLNLAIQAIDTLTAHIAKELGYGH